MSHPVSLPRPLAKASLRLPPGERLLYVAGRVGEGGAVGFGRGDVGEVDDHVVGTQGLHVEIAIAAALPGDGSNGPGVGRRQPP